jgi:hypothetical protein
MVTLRIGFGVALPGEGAAWAGGDAVPDDDFLRADEDVLPATGLPGAVIVADHRVNNGAQLPAHAATPRLSQIVTIQAPAAAACGESQPRQRHYDQPRSQSPLIPHEPLQ